MKKRMPAAVGSWFGVVGALLAGTAFLSGCGSKPPPPAPPPHSAVPITLNQQQLQQRRQYLREHPGVKPPPGVQVQ